MAWSQIWSSETLACVGSWPPTYLGQGLGHFYVSTARHCALQKRVPAFPCLGAMCPSSWLLFPGVQAAGWSTGNASGWHLAWLEHLG